MRVYHDRFYVGLAVGVLYALCWQAVLLPVVWLVVSAVLVLGISAWGWRRTRAAASSAEKFRTRRDSGI